MRTAHRAPLGLLGGAILVALGVFAAENARLVGVRFLSGTFTVGLWAIVGACAVLG
nr:hypothetical protein [Ktedonobacterales bacterium]